MFPGISNPNPRMHTLRLPLASARQTQAVLLAALVLCAAILAGTPAFGASSKAHSNSTTNHQGWQVGVVIPDNQAEVNATADLTGTFKVHPDVKTLLTAIVLYNPKNCAEYTPGNWTLNSDSKYGDIYKGHVSGHLVNGACHKFIYTGDGIYYKWVLDIHATKDKFKATWKGDSDKIPVTFDLILVK
jgi:hypothetical protein